MVFMPSLHMRSLIGLLRNDSPDDGEVYRSMIRQGLMSYTLPGPVPCHVLHTIACTRLAALYRQIYYRAPVCRGFLLSEWKNQPDCAIPWTAVVTPFQWTDLDLYPPPSSKRGKRGKNVHKKSFTAIDVLLNQVDTSRHTWRQCKDHEFLLANVELWQQGRAFWHVDQFPRSCSSRMRCATYKDPATRADVSFEHNIDASQLFGGVSIDDSASPISRALATMSRKRKRGADDDPHGNGALSDEPGRGPSMFGPSVWPSLCLDSFGSLPLLPLSASSVGDADTMQAASAMISLSGNSQQEVSIAAQSRLFCTAPESVALGACSMPSVARLPDLFPDNTKPLASVAEARELLQSPDGWSQMTGSASDLYRNLSVLLRGIVEPPAHELATTHVEEADADCAIRFTAARLASEALSTFIENLCVYTPPQFLSADSLNRRIAVETVREAQKSLSTLVNEFATISPTCQSPGFVARYFTLLRAIRAQCSVFNDAVDTLLALGQ